MKPLKLLLFCLIITGLSASFIQQDGLLESLRKKLYEYTHENPSTSLYLHTDKNIYAAGEDIWFKAYTLSATMADSKVLHVRLVSAGRQIIIDEQFPMYGLRAHGDLVLPDTLTAGDYSIFAYTDRMINFSEQDIFVQHIKVYPAQAEQLQASASLSDTLKPVRGKEATIGVTLTKGGQRVKNARGEFRLYNGDVFIKAGRVSTDNSGEAAISFTYPALPDTASLSVKIKFSQDKGFASASLNLPHEGNPVCLSVFPEGGHFIAGIPATAALTATDIHGNPVSALVLVKNGERVIATVRTSDRGIGTFTLKPRHGDGYSLEMPGNQKSVFADFPQTEAQGYGLRITKQKDQLQAILYNKGETGPAMLVVRSFENILWSMPLSLAAGDSLTIPLPSEGLPSEVLSLAVFNQNGALRAERLFLNSRQEEYRLNLQTGQQQYGARTKVTVALSATDKAGRPVEANLSVAVVERARMDTAAYPTIRSAFSYRFLNGAMAAGISRASLEEIDNLLISRNWWKADWASVISYAPKGFLKLIKNTDGVTGSLKQNPYNRGKDSKNSKYEVQANKLFASSKKGTFTIPLNPDSTFQIPSSMLLAERNSYWRLISLTQNTYVVSYRNEDLDFDRKALSMRSLNIPPAFITRVKPGPVKTFSLSGVNILQEVAIKKNQAGLPDEFRPKTCNDDYVCMENILNCWVHPPGTEGNNKPVSGGIYSLELKRVYFGVTYNFKTDGPFLKKIVYYGCTPPGRSPYALKNITIPREFSLAGHDNNPVAEPQYRSTVYWNPNITTDASGKATFSFFTSDIKGDFIITAQGVEIGTVKPVYGTAGFRVN